MFKSYYSCGQRIVTYAFANTRCSRLTFFYGIIVCVVNYDWTKCEILSNIKCLRINTCRTFPTEWMHEKKWVFCQSSKPNRPNLKKNFKLSCKGIDLVNSVWVITMKQSVCLYVFLSPNNRYWFTKWKKRMIREKKSEAQKWHNMWMNDI